MESHTTGFPPFPLLLEIPLGFPHSPPAPTTGYLYKEAHVQRSSEIS